MVFATCEIYYISCTFFFPDSFAITLSFFKTGKQLGFEQFSLGSQAHADVLFFFQTTAPAVFLLPGFSCCTCCFLASSSAG